MIQRILRFSILSVIVGLSGCSNWEQTTQLNTTVQQYAPFDVVDRAQHPRLQNALIQVLKRRSLFSKDAQQAHLIIHQLVRNQRTVSTGVEGDPRLKRLQYQATFSLETDQNIIIPKTTVVSEYDLYEQFNQALQDASEHQQLDQQLIDAIVQQMLIRLYIKDAYHVTERAH